MRLWIFFPSNIIRHTDYYKGELSKMEYEIIHIPKES